MTRNVDVRRTAAALALTGVAAAAPAAFADERDEEIRELREAVRRYAETTERLERKVESLEGRQLAPADEGTLRAAIDAFLREEGESGGSYVGPGGVRRPVGRMDWGGYFSTRFVNSETPDSNPAFQDMRFVLQVHADVTEKIWFDGEIEYEHGGIGGGAAGEVAIEYAELSFSECEAFVFKAGTLLAPWGRFNAQHDDPLNELSSRPTVSRIVHGVVLRGPGVGAEGVLACTDDVSFNYDVVLTNGLEDTFSSSSGIRGSRTLWEDDENHDKTVFGRVGALLAGGDLVDALDVGASFAYGKLGPDGEHDMVGYGVDAAAKVGPWEFKGEWAHLGVDRDDSAAPPVDPTGALGPIRGMHGWYAQLLYRFTDPWVRSLPFADDSASVGVLVRRDAVDINDRVLGATETDDEGAWSFGVNYRPTTKTVIKVEYRNAKSSWRGPEGDDRDLIAVEFATYF